MMPKSRETTRTGNLDFIKTGNLVYQGHCQQSEKTGPGRGSNGRAPTQQVEDPELKSQYQNNNNKKGHLQKERCANHMPDKGLVSRVNKERLQLSIKKTTQLENRQRMCVKMSLQHSGGIGKRTEFETSLGYTARPYLQKKKKKKAKDLNRHFPIKDTPMASNIQKATQYH
jgi:hypothetical protein